VIWTWSRRTRYGNDWPDRLDEKDLCWTGAGGSEKLSAKVVPGADWFTRGPDDTFVPLEERTRIANEAKADSLFRFMQIRAVTAGARHRDVLFELERFSRSDGSGGAGKFIEFRTGFTNWKTS